MRRAPLTPGPRARKPAAEPDANHHAAVPQFAPVLPSALIAQRQLGNRVVSRMLSAPAAPVLQRLSKLDTTKLGKGAYKENGIVASKVAAWQKAGGISDEGMSRLISGLTVDNLISVLTMSADQFKFADTEEDAEEVGQKALVKMRNVAMQERVKAESAKLAAAKPKDKLTQALEDTGASEGDVAAFMKSEAGNTAAVKAWVEATTGEVARRTIELCVRRSASLAAAEALITLGDEYDPLAVIEWAKTSGMAALTTALEQTADDTSENYVRLWLSSGATAGSAPSYKKLVRLEARIQDGIGALTVEKADRNYAGSKDPPSRTGFLEYDFGGDTASVHTHWNTEKKKLVSMHVQEGGANSTEIHKWVAFFPQVPGAVLAAHNAGTGTKAPTTDPTGGSLTLDLQAS